MNLKKIAFNLGVASLFATSAPSFAVDGKTFPGSYVPAYQFHRGRAAGGL